MAGQLSDGTTVFASHVSIGGVDSNSAGFGRLSVASTVQVVAGPVLSTGALDLRSNSVVLSMATGADSAGMTIGQLRLVFAASGVSLVYSSGATVYTVGASAVSAAQA